MNITYHQGFAICLFLICCALFIQVYDDIFTVRKISGQLRSYNQTLGESGNDHKSGNTKEKEIIILSWTAYWTFYRPVFVKNSSDCLYLNTSITNGESSRGAFTVPCRFTYDRRYLNQSDSVIFHAWDMQHTDLPSRVSDDQIWIYLQQEPPGHEHMSHLDLSKYPDFFNWTMTHRRDSDVFHPYGYVVPLQEENLNFEIRPEWRNRPSLVAWIVTNCEANSKREKLVQQLQKFIPIDIYGRCGRPCPPKSKPRICHLMINTTYKFYLSFENSLCLDYITEKFFNALETNMVPVVYGGYTSSDYSVIAPKDSYIDARDFQSAKELADYLIYLDQNDDEYEKYFQWKRKYYIVHADDPRQEYCNLCQRLYEERFKSKRERKQQQHRDLMKWWHYHDDGYGSLNPVCLYPIQRLTGP